MPVRYAQSSLLQLRLKASATANTTLKNSVQGLKGPAHNGPINERINMTLISKPCMLCGKRTEKEFTEAEARKYFTEYLGQGKCIQSVFPDMPQADREFLVSGMCDKCQDKIFGPEE